MTCFAEIGVVASGGREGTIGHGMAWHGMAWSCLLGEAMGGGGCTWCGERSYQVKERAMYVESWQGHHDDDGRGERREREESRRGGV